jgi:aspartyl-tRNA(Asn)/glutamyl-tRNA(Gln) amidotransferase subunit A
VAPAGVLITEVEPGAGRPLAVKDLFDTAGVRTTYGSAVFAEHVPSASAEAVRRCEAAGWVDAGKTNLHEFAYGVTSQNLHYGTVPNPSFPGRTAGGSSGGTAAAIVLGIAAAGLGTDSGGSIRIPAACCGIVGFKPTYGLVSTDGVFPLAPSYDHAGPMAADVATCVELMGVLAGLEPEEPRPVRVGLAWTALAETAIGALVERVAPLAGVVQAVDFPLPERTTGVFMHEVAEVHRELYAEHEELYGENIRPKIERCLALGEAEAAAAAAARSAYAETAIGVFDEVDVLVTPTLPVVPPPEDVDEIAVRESMIRFTYPFNLLGWPALALPCGLVDRLPASIQIVGRPGADAAVLAAGAELEAALAALAALQ